MSYCGRGSFRLCKWAILVTAVLLGGMVVQATAELVDIPGATANFVVHISVDALNVRSIQAWGQDDLPNFWKFRTQGAWTDNARTDFNRTVTSPNHWSILTGRPVYNWPNKPGHLWGENVEDPWNTYHLSVHQKHNFSELDKPQYEYVASTFDVASDAGMRTGLFAGKKRFLEVDHSYDRLHSDNGEDKINYSLVKDVKQTNIGDGLQPIVTAWKNQMDGADPLQYSFIHFCDTDPAGHQWGWSTTPTSNPYSYMNTIKQVDKMLGKIFNEVQTNPDLKGKTAIVLTSDHGGLAGSKEHNDTTKPDDFRVPLYVWGPGVKAGANLYDLNPSDETGYANPGDIGRPNYNALLQPIRNGDSANLCMSLLGLDAIPVASMDTMDDDGYYALRVGDEPLRAASHMSASSMMLASSPMLDLSGQVSGVPEPSVAAALLSAVACWGGAEMIRRRIKCARG
jgi:hypothetical protein